MAIAMTIRSVFLMSQNLIGTITISISIVVSFHHCTSIGLAIASFFDLVFYRYPPNYLCHHGGCTHSVIVVVGSNDCYWIQRGSHELQQNSTMIDVAADFPVFPPNPASKFLSYLL